MALLIWYQLLNNPRTPQPGDSQHGSLLGPACDDEEIRAFLDTTNAESEYVGSDDALCNRVADAIAAGQAQVLHARLLVHVTSAAEHDLLSHFLD